MPCLTVGTFTQLAADNFRRAADMKERLVAELEQKHKTDPRHILSG